MNSTSWSIGKICLPLLFLWLTACQTRTVHDSSHGADFVKSELKDEISLKADRSELGEMRSQISVDKKEQNDELALILKLMNENQIKPSDLQSKYSQLVQKKRNSFREKVGKLREKFKTRETDSRNQFLEQQKLAREEFKKKKVERKEATEFFTDQDKARLNFFANLQSERKDFESELQSQTKDFDSYMQERQREFAEQVRLYSKRYHELEKEKAAANSANAAGSGPKPSGDAISKEFEEMQKKPAVQLKAGEENSQSK